MFLFNRIRQPRLASLFAFIGACSFWFPDIVVHAFERLEFTERDAWLITFLSPLFFLLTYSYLHHMALRHSYTRPGMAMIAGVWMLSGVFMMISATFSGGGFASRDPDALVWSIVGVIPIFTLMMSTFDGSLLALLAISFGGLVIIAIRASLPRQRPVV